MAMDQKIAAAKGIVDIGVGLFGQDSSAAANVKSNQVTREQLDIDDEAIDKIMADILGSEQGLASIFGAEGATGIFSGSNAKNTSANLMAALAGEIAKLTAVKTTETVGQQDSVSDTSKEGLLGDKPLKKIGGVVRKLIDPTSWF